MLLEPERVVGSACDGMKIVRIYTGHQSHVWLPMVATAGHAVKNNMSLFAALCCAGQRGWELPGRAMWRLGVWPGGGPDVATLSEVPEEFRSQCGLAVGFYASQLFGA